MPIIEGFCNRISDFNYFSHKKHTKNLTHEDIAEISKCLPMFPWNEDSGIKDAKKNILEIYKISNNELSKAIEIIKNNRKYSGSLGECQQLKFISLSKLSDFVELCFKYEKIKISKKHISNNDGVFDINIILEPDDEFDSLEEIIRAFLKNLSYDELADIVTLADIGRDRDCNEFYESTLQLYQGKAKERISWEDWLIRKMPTLHHWILKSLHELGLFCLLRINKGSKK